ncbi:MAG: DAK2 domain-containing protein [Oscillospiraceae bacterium]|jgi:DAK2 domain fusion protein YloV|nr:DAK2 domain-containing protein [Oscillospiraceae bacterium]
MIINAAAAIENHRQEINELNVFPVPDGDTGTNLSLTINAAEKALEAMTPGTLGHAAEVTAGALLRGARGNSGVILSLLFRGFSRRLKDVDSADAASFASALEAGVESAYKAVMKPAEGTILTVSRIASNTAVETAQQEDDIEIVLERALAEGYIALAETVNQNPVLKKAGVIDAGAKGYLHVLEGMLKALLGETLIKEMVDTNMGGKADFSQYTAEDIRFAYCTEFIAERKFKTDTNRLRDFLDVRGDSVVVVEDDEIIKVHVHTNEPGAVLTEALTYGPLLSVKIDCMRQQHSETLFTNEETGQIQRESKERREIADAASAAGATGAAGVTDATGAADAAEMKEAGFVVVCAGAGIEEVFRDLGADKLITGGQTMNPSTEDILRMIDATPSSAVFVLPNNKNIILAAEQCIPLTKKRVIVIPTKSVPQGVSAMLAVDGVSGVDDMIECMTEAALRVHTAMITQAARDSIFDGRSITEGEYIALFEDSLTASGSDVNTVIDAVAETLSGFSPEYITVYAGEDVGEDEAASVAERIGNCAPGAETSVILGGQPVYYYIISAE